jgi:hypothetical protein
MATETKTSVELRCPWCGGMATWQIDTADLRTVTCYECGDTVVPADAVAKLRDQAARWERFAAVIDSLKQI